MQIGKVRGTVVSSTKHPSMNGLKLLIVQEMDPETLEYSREINVVADASAAGEGDVVMYCRGSSARFADGLGGFPIDEAVVAILDSICIDETMIYEKKDDV